MPESLKLNSRIKKGDTAAFKEFYFLKEEHLFYYFLKKVHHHEDAEDLTQQTFVKLWQHRASISDDHLMDVVLFQNAREVFIDWLRNKSVQQKRKSAAESMYYQRPSHLAPQPNHESLQLAIQRLPPMRQKVIRLSHLEGYSYKEIASYLNLSVKTVDNHVRLALKQLRKILVPVLLILFL